MTALEFIATAALVPLVGFAWMAVIAGLAVIVNILCGARS